MFSPCVACLSSPCACPVPECNEGRYSYQTATVCSYCYSTPCSCVLMTGFKNFETEAAYCVSCSCKPCICPPTTAAADDCPCGVCKECQPFVPEEECYCGGDYECFACEPVEFTQLGNCACEGMYSCDVCAPMDDDCPCGVCDDCNVWVPEELPDESCPQCEKLLTIINFLLEDFS
jgi:hypothetical protein